MGDRVRLDDGRELLVRPVRPDDTEALREMHRRHSPRTVHLRFFASVPELSRPMAERFTHVDGDRRFALVVEGEDGELVAVARYDRLGETGDSAEVAFVVTDRYQHHGLGTALVRLLAAHAREAGVRELVADVLEENLPMLHAFADAGLHAATTHNHGVAHLVMPLDGTAQPAVTSR